MRDPRASDVCIRTDQGFRLAAPRRHAVRDLAGPEHDRAVTGPVGEHDRSAGDVFINLRWSARGIRRPAIDGACVVVAGGANVCDFFPVRRPYWRTVLRHFGSETRG